MRKWGLINDRRGAVSAIAALALPLVIGTAGLVVEYGHGVLEKVENQRVADASAFAGAIAYNATSSQTSMTSAAQGVAALNSIPAAQVAVALVASPSGVAGANAVRVTVTTSVPLIFARVLGQTSDLSVPAAAYAELRPSLSACIIALSGSTTGVALTGGTSVQAPACAVASNAAVTVPCGTTLRAVSVAYNSTAAPSAPCGGITGPGGAAPTLVKQVTTDPLAGNANVTTARERLVQVAALVTPSTPLAPTPPVIVAPSGTFRDIDLAYNDSSTQAQAVALGCTAVHSGSTWTLTCPVGTYNFNNFTVGGGISVNLSGTAATVYNFAQPMNTGPAIGFGPGVFTFVQGLSIGYGGVTFGAGSLSVKGNLTTGSSGGTASFASTDVTVSGNVSFNSTTTLSGGGTLAVGGSLTTAGTTSIAQPTIRVSEAFAITAPAAFNTLTSLSVGGAMTIGTYGTMSFSGGNWSITGGLTTSGSSVITIGAGSYNFGRTAASCNGGRFSLCSNAASLIFAGPSTFLLPSGVTAGGGSTLILGSSGTGNSFRIGPSTNGGNAVQIGGGATFKMGDATDTASLFEINGNFNISSGGGSCTVVGAASQHDINGSLLTAGATILGAGVYTIYGSAGLGANGGGNVMCNGASTGLLANGVSLVLGGNGTALTGSCANQAFCVAAGYQNVVLVASTAGTYAKLAIVGPASSSRGAYFTEGSTGTSLSGVVYFPTESVRLDGAASVGNGTGQCLQLIGQDISLNGGSLLASTCISGSASGGQAVLVK